MTLGKNIDYDHFQKKITLRTASYLLGFKYVSVGNIKGFDLSIADGKTGVVLEKSEFRVAPEIMQTIKSMM